MNTLYVISGVGDTVADRLSPCLKVFAQGFSTFLSNRGRSKQAVTCSSVEHVLLQLLFEEGVR